jgi:hypothetical protein
MEMQPMSRMRYSRSSYRHRITITIIAIFLLSNYRKLPKWSQELQLQGWQMALSANQLYDNH